MRSPTELTSMSKDLFRTLTGRDYFRMRQPMGLFQSDPRCYYSDLRGKAYWSGEYQEGVPALFVPRMNCFQTLPVMVLHYGLGSIDSYFATGDRAFLPNVEHVARWILHHLNDRFYCANGIVERDPEGGYLSDNSAMSQGELLSFAVRAINYDLLEDETAQRLNVYLGPVLENMLSPIENEGTVLRRGDDLLFCEFCSSSGLVVLNGWIFAVFGLIDFLRWWSHAEAQSALKQTMQTMVRWVSLFECPNGWSLYDNQGRISSPNYHYLHIQLLNALNVLTGEAALHEVAVRFEHAYTTTNCVRYTMRKIIEKLHDTEAYTTQQDSGARASTV